MESALSNPGGPQDVILRENDVLDIPVQSNVVRVFGAVMYPTAVTWNAKMTVADYIDAAGGYSQNARKTKKYVVSMGGRAQKVSAASKVEPGAEIFVPDKGKKEKPDYSGIIAISSAATSVATLGVTIMTLVNNVKK
jgi:protein involved in polysaccharide export with SLBB domain